MLQITFPVFCSIHIINCSTLNQLNRPHISTISNKYMTLLYSMNQYFSYLCMLGLRELRRWAPRQRPRTAGWLLSQGTGLSPAGSWPLRCGRSPRSRTRQRTGSSRPSGRTWRDMPRLGNPELGRDTKLEKLSLALAERKQLRKQPAYKQLWMPSRTVWIITNWYCCEYVFILHKQCIIRKLLQSSLIT